MPIVNDIDVSRLKMTSRIASMAWGASVAVGCSMRPSAHSAITAEVGPQSLGP